MLFRSGDVAFSDGPVFELGLELLVRFFGQGEQQHTRGVHIEAVDYERSRSCGITLPSPVEDRRSFRFSGDGEHPGRFEDGGYPAIFVQKFRGGLRAGAIGFGLDVESPKHVGENRAAFASAGGIVVSVTADFAFRRGSPPEFGDRQRSEPTLLMRMFVVLPGVFCCVLWSCSISLAVGGCRGYLPC